MSATDIARSRAYADQLLAKSQEASRYICQNGEYDETGKPTIENPNPGTTYYVPSKDGAENDKYTEWEFLDGAWEQKGSGALPSGEYATSQELQDLEDKVDKLSETVSENIDAAVSDSAEKMLPGIAQECVQDALDTTLAVVLF